MKMRDKEFDKLLRDTMKWEADRIMEEVESDPELKDVVAPESIHENLMKQIQEKKENDKKKSEPHKRLTPDEQELIRLGIKYRKNHGKGKYFILVAAIVCALGVGTISIGGKEKVVTEVKRIFSGREQTVVNTGDDDVLMDEISNEEDAYERINDVLGFYPIKVLYLPEGMHFDEVAIEQDLQNARFYYVGDNGQRITYYIVTDHRESSINIDVEDKFVQEYDKLKDDTNITVQEYLVEENNTSRWLISFSDRNAQYWLLVMGIEEQEINKIIDNLYFN